MRTMASVWFLVTVLVIVHEVYGNICLDDNYDISSCDKCIRCGGNWCNDRNSGAQCVFTLSDEWCSDHQEPLFRLNDFSRPGDLVVPAYAERTLGVGVIDAIDIRYTQKTPGKAQISIKNSTQKYNIELWEPEPARCLGHNCTTTINVKASEEFCTDSGTTTEFVYATVKVGGLDEVIGLKYHVPCACNCSKVVEKNSKLCSGHGDLSCGVCTCHSEWTGDDCSKPDCPKNKRGDVQCTNPLYDQVECSGNGYCGPCDSCVCYTDREFSHYYDSQNYCADLCMITSNCDDCLTNTTMGSCDACIYYNVGTYKMPYNASLLNERDEFNRTVWMKCNETINDCFYNYVVKKDGDSDIYLMVVESCNNIIAGGQTAAPQVSIILGVIVLLALVAAAAGFMIWKHMTALPPPPLNNPGYQNIDAEDCTGVNPLYKPPTTNFQNPTYGKW